MKRTLIILAIVIVLLGIGAALYFYFSAKGPGIEVGSTPTLPTVGQSQVDSGNTTTAPAQTPPGASARLVEISVGPVVPGLAVVNIPNQNASSSSDVAVHYLERQSGNAFYYLTHNRGITRTSNRTVPGIENALWLPDASTALVQYLSGDTFSTINTYALTASGSDSLTGGGQGFFLPQNLSSIAVSSSSILTLASGVNGSVASVEHTDGTKASLVFTTPLSSLRASFAGKVGYLAFTKPSATLMGNAFLVDASGHFSRVAGPLNGLAALTSPSGKWVLVSYTLSNEMHLQLVSTETNQVIPLPIASIIDKCVWAADDSSVYCGVPVNPPLTYAYPDDWYQGAVHFSDRIWKIDVSGRFTQLVLDFTKETNGSLDAISLALDPQGTTLAFVNKNDGSLWSYQL